MNDIDNEKLKDEIDEIMKNVDKTIKNIETLYPLKDKTPEEDSE